MLCNLVGNAIKFTGQGQIRISGRELSRDQGSALLEFAVTDTGVGIAVDKQQQLFKPFVQADSSTTREFGGTGLGLSITRRLAELMGGEAGVRSEVGVGSTFWFRIRADILDTDLAAYHSRPQPLESDQVFSQPPSFSGEVLVVDDNPANRTVIRAILHKLGVQCALVEDGQQAVERITRGMAPGLVLMDCQMPVMDGFEATRRIRHWEHETGHPRLAIVALTAGAFEKDRHLCMEAGMDDFMAKPIEIRKVIEILGQWLPELDTATSPSCAMSEPPSAPGSDLLDLDTPFAQMGGDLETLVTVAAIVAQQVRDEGPLIAGHGLERDCAALALACHRLKSSLSSIGATVACEECVRLEALAKAADLSALDAALLRLADSLAQALPELDRVAALPTH
jgi:CheY-like chemotaxis protein/HPt (histidine-containing phosphotransfer) domain-containing protein